jgi:hypothetical protein
MEQLQYNCNFVLPAHILNEVRDIFPSYQDVLAHPVAANTITGAWILRTYCELKLAGQDTTLSHSLKSGVINFVGPRDFGRRNARSDVFIVIPRGDAHWPMLANFIIEQNTLSPQKNNTAGLPHWPQFDIKPRSVDRETSIQVLSYKGRYTNLAPEFRRNEFNDELKKRGIVFEFDDIGDNTSNNRWDDYSSVDLVLAIRDITIYDAKKKPASKLLNAWFAGVPAILGPEPAYRELRRSALDYIEVRTPDEAIAAIDQLVHDKSLFKAMIENGKTRALDYTSGKLCSMWIELINDRIGPRFDQWKAEGLAERKLRYIASLATEPISKKIDRIRFTRGRRIITG